ncbi:uncharacterized protein N7511_007922 [Penicillium nucicola]|uniref:uncharacterized protein n=1 Tax=Penicillium nucicola TaxID=1850975 RepID=UPI002544F262|nr:uncharacterized protein N7511_007922 [Penicillium nucicola]KAJ5753769.1 hypothetical protein N7511_007922 [Penicillium nucicola]
MNILPESLSGAENQSAKNTCARCKGSKKKCDKALPSCARCSRLSLSCAYDEPSDAPDTSAGSEFLLKEILRRIGNIENHLSKDEDQESAEENQTILPQTAHASEEPANRTEVQNWQIKPSLLRPSYRAFLSGIDLMRFIEVRKTSMDKIRQTYSQHYGWLPIISERLILNEFSIIQNNESSVACATLVFSMLLVTSNPFDDEERLSPTESHLYLTTKYHFTLSASLSYPSIELVQAGILIAVYEFTQGAGDMAYVTIGTCARLSSLLGLHRAVSCPANMTVEVQNVTEEQNCTWWGIVVVDR